MVAAPLRIVFFGTPAFAVPTLDALLASRHTVAGVVTQPDRPRGRGQKPTNAPVKIRALAAGVPILQPDTLRDATFIAALAALEADLGVVAAYGKILNETVLGTPARGLINVHASLLPRHRGAAPVHRAVIAGDSETGITIMRVVKALDAGAMLAVARRAIGAEETSADVERDLARLGAALLADTVERLAAGPIEEVPQNDALATYASRLTKDEGAIDWSQSAQTIHNRIRGLHPWPHASAMLGDRRLILHRSTIPDAAGTPRAAQPGEIVGVGTEGLDVIAGAGVLRLTELQAEGKRAMPAREFLAGHHVVPGDRFRRQP